MGLFHMRLAHDSDAPSPAAVLWKRAPLCLGRKNWRARKAGRAARKRLLAGDMAGVCVFVFFGCLVGCMLGRCLLVGYPIRRSRARDFGVVGTWEADSGCRTADKGAVKFERVKKSFGLDVSLPVQ